MGTGKYNADEIFLERKGDSQKYDVLLLQFEKTKKY